jgi:hypothetical protein
LSKGTFESNKLNSGEDGYENYLKITFANSDSIVINSGPYDNRNLLDNFKDEWCLEYECLNENKQSVDLQIELRECKYDSVSYGYIRVAGNFSFGKNGKGKFTEEYNSPEGVKVYLDEVFTNNYSNSEFSKKS